MTDPGQQLQALIECEAPDDLVRELLAYALQELMEHEVAARAERRRGVRFTIATPLRILAREDETPAALLVVVTEATLRRDRRARAAFWAHVRSVDAALDAQPGCLGHALRRELFGRRAWTLSLWTREANMSAFLAAAAHRRAVAEAMRAVAATRFHRFEATRAEIGWTEALARLDARRVAP